MIKTIIILLFLLSLNIALAEDTHTGIKFGAGVGKAAEQGYLNTKFFALDYQKQLLDIAIQQWEVGAWIDPNSGQGRKSSAFLGYSIGLETVTNSGLYAKALFGPSVISAKDSYLGGNFQFHEDFGFGIRGTNDVGIGLNYSHFSSGGIFLPNVGRDFLMLNVTLPF